MPEETREAAPQDSERTEGRSRIPVSAEAEYTFFEDRRRMAQTALAVVLIVVAIYVLLPQIVGLEGALNTIREGDLAWIGLALAFSVFMFGAYVSLFRGVVGEQAREHLGWRTSYQITMAGLAATRLFSAGGAGGIVLTYWALRKAGMERRQSVRRMIAFLVLLYTVYMSALIIFGILLRTGVLSGSNPVGLTIVPAAIAGAAVLIVFLIALLPEDFERRIAGLMRGERGSRIAGRIATGPSTFAQGTRTAIDFVRTPSRGALAVAGAAGFWAANIAILWAAFKAFDVEVPLGVVVQGFFVGMAANLFPLAPGGVGAVDAGMIGTFVLFGLPSSEVFAAVLSYRVIAFWLPIPPGVVAFLQLRQTVARWEAEDPSAAERGAILQKVKRYPRSGEPAKERPGGSNQEDR